MRDYKLLINGGWEESATIKEIRSPYDRQVAGRVCWASKDQVERAIAAADRAFLETRKMASYERSLILSRISQGIKARKDILAESIARQAGKPIRDSRLEVDRAALTFEIASEEAKRRAGGGTLG